MDRYLPKIFISEVGVTTLPEKKALEFIIRGLKKSGKKGYIVTLNPEIIVFASKNPGFKSILNNATLGLPDGIGVIWASRILGKRKLQRITGVDFMKKLCKMAAKEGLAVGFLGGRGEMAERTAECLVREYPKLKVGFIGSEWSKGGFVHKDEAESRKQELWKSANKTHNSKFIIHNSIDILFVAFGFPKQELWMAENLKKIPVRIAMGVGGSFDIIGGRLPRAPIWIQNLGFEWLFRLVIEPWRFKRQLALFKFIYLLVLETLANSSKRVNTIK